MCISVNLQIHHCMMCCCLATQHGSMLLPYIVSFTCVGIDYAGSASPEDWRQVEDLFDRIRNCGESGGHTDSDA